MHNDPMSCITPSPRLVTEWVESIDSTNAEIFRRTPLVDGDADALWLVARRQTAGRGRLARRWVSTPDASLTASLGLEAPLPRQPASLSLAVGATIAAVLAGFGAECRVKWPNDLYRRSDAGDWCKVGGILCELRSGASRARIAIGVGLNLAPGALAGLDAPAGGAVGASVAAGAAAVRGGCLFASPQAVPDRLLLAGALGAALHRAARRFLADGLGPFLDDWRSLDCLAGQPIVVHRIDGEGVAGIAKSIDDDGALLVEAAGAPGRLQRVVSDEVSIRLRNDVTLAR
ncbi:MAG: biotin--[acetyl-CoA-carboxylase] ligase [Lautropia sp.]